MAKTSQDSKRDNRTSITLIIVLLGSGLIVVLFLIMQKISLIRIDSEIIKDQNRIIVNLNDKKARMFKEIEKYEGIQTSIDKIKAEYFIDAQTLEQMIISDATDIKIAYLTFDDGPYLLTAKILDVLNEYETLATFFTLGKSLDLYEDIYWRIIDSGHTLANHTYSHDLSKTGIYTSESKFIDDLLRQHDFILKNFNVNTNLLRFPGGSVMIKRFSSTFKEKISDLGYGYIDWNVSSGDGGGPVQEPEALKNNVLNTVYNKKIICVLMHDYSYNTYLALPDIIESLQAKGFIFLPLFYESTMIKK